MFIHYNFLKWGHWKAPVNENEIVEIITKYRAKTAMPDKALTLDLIPVTIKRNFKSIVAMLTI